MNSCSGNKRGLPVSRDLVRIIRESSKTAGHHNVTLGEEMQMLEERQCKAVEFYIRACALRLGQID